MANKGISEYDVIFKSKVADFKDLPVRAFRNIGLHDSIFTFYPTATVVVNDSAGILMDNIYFVEGLEFDLQIGNSSKKYVGTKYVWSQNVASNMRITDFVSSDVNFSFIHANFSSDNPRTRGWEDSISNIVKEIVKEDYNHKDFSFISDTTGKQIHYQASRTNSKFIDALSNVAFSKDDEKSPYYTFFNSNGEFYFASLGFLFNQQPIGTYKFIDDSFTDEFAIKSAEIQSLGLPISNKLYKQKIYKIKQDGSEISEDFAIKDFYYKIDNKHKLLIEKDTVTDIPTRMLHLGIIGDFEKEFYQGMVNNIYTNMNTMYRMTVVVEFNRETVAGKVINLDVASPNKKKAKGTEHSGKWLIVESNYHMSINGEPYCQLTLAKPGIKIDSTHPLIKNFVG